MAIATFCLIIDCFSSMIGRGANILKKKIAQNETCITPKALLTSRRAWGQLKPISFHSTGHWHRLF